MGDYSIAFITCVNDEELYEECVRYIDKLNVPEGFNIRKIAIRDAKSMTSAYNEVIQESNSKYKVYLHQDTFIINKNFVLDCLNVFGQDEKIGMLGVIGAERLPTKAIWWESKHLKGKTYESSSGKMELLDFDTNKNDKEYTEVQAIDGFIMITQYDVKWREDIFDGWHFYDISQCMEFKNAGYKVVIPNQENHWCVHDCGLINLENGYEQYRNKFLDIYTKDIFPMVSILIPSCDSKEKLYNSLDRILNQTYRNIEIIVMCEESDKKELKEILNNNITFYLNKEELTANENIDKILFDAKGEYFYIVNTNNLMKKNKIEKMMSNMIDSELAVVLNGLDFDDNIGLNNSNVAINGQKACNYIINNFDKLLANNVSAIINKKFYINQYGCFKEQRFKYIENIATLTNCLMYGDLLCIKEKLDEEWEDYNSNNLDWQSNLFSIQEMIILSKYLRNEMIFKDTNEFDNFIGNIKKYYKRIVDNINCLNYDDKKNLIDCIDNLTKDLINKYDFNFKYIGDNVKILKDSNFIVPEGMIIEENVSIFENATFMLPYGCGRIVIKKGCDLGRRIFVSATNSITIENDVIIASNVHITDHNHEYKKIGIPIMKQGVTSFTNEVVIGEGSWIANGCVIVGNIKIGRGCVIGANSVVLNDIPDYCVAVGSPAKVVKYFDRIKGEWVKVKNDGEYQEYKNSLENVKPLLTIGIPTYNRSKYLKKCLDSIFDQVGNNSLVEVLVSDNCSTDNTEELVRKYMNKYTNLTYNRNESNIGPEKNIMKLLEISLGEYVNIHGDDDYFNNGIIYQIINMIYDNRECAVMYALPKSSELNIKQGNGVNEYIKDVSYICTFISGLILRKDSCQKLNNISKYDGSFINQVYVQLELLKDNEKYCVLSGNIFSKDSGGHSPSGYNFGEVFIRNYFEILNEYKDYGLTKEVLKDEKYMVLNCMILPWVYKITNENISLGLNDFIEIFSEYYSEEYYLDEALNKIKEILKLK